MTDQILFTPYTLGDLTLSNRVVLAPLTRNRAGQGFVPSEFAATYYSQRASAGLLISEASQISQQGQGYQDTPGIYTQAQIDGWRTVTEAVHAKGGRIFPATVACRPRFPRRPASEWCGAGGPLRPASGDQGLRQQ
nr:hypothetical protein GCM10020185_84010 [Pseudomonas brassicacearum subsp. brassicacearum]